MVSPGDVDRLFLQAVLSRGIVSSDLAQILWGKCIKAVNNSNEALNVRHSKDKESWGKFITSINKSLDKLDLEFRSLHDEMTGREMYALVNTKGDEIAQLATDYTPAEITYFKGIVEQIMIAPNEAFVASSFVALREPGSLGLTSITKSHAEVILASFVAKGWLLKTKTGYYSLSTRSLIELQPYLKSNYPDEVLECTACSQILTRGFACPTEDCKSRIHSHCLTGYRRVYKICPSCKKDWPPDLVPVGENAHNGDNRRQTRYHGSEEQTSDDETEQQPSQNSPAPKKTGRRIVKRAAQREASMDVDEDEDEDEDVKPAKTQSRPRRSARH